MTLLVRGVMWPLIYIGAVAAPLVLLLVGDTPPGRGFWTDFSVGLGFVGLAMLGLQFAVTARFNPVDAPFGLDAVIQYHRQISIVAYVFILAHPAILIIQTPGRLGMLNPVTATTAERWGLLAVTALTVLLVVSIWRKQLRIRYEVWRVSHGFLAVVVVGAALIHIERAGYYVSQPWSRGLWILMSVALVGLLLYVRVYKPWLMTRRPYLVEGVRKVAPETWALTLEPDGHDGLRFEPGQFAWITIERTPFHVREHPFSFSSSAEQTDRYEFTIKELGDFTSRIGEIEPSTRAYLDGPYGAFSSDRYQAPGYVFIAGGVGIGPIMSMLRTLDDLQDRRPSLLIYGNSSFGDIIYREEIDALGQRLDLRIVHVLENPPDDWVGETGYIDGDLLGRHLPLREERYQYFVCGPGPMMDDVEQALTERGIPADGIQLERFEFV
jgi:predicted ferric reductase